MHMEKIKNNNGFTLIELLVTLTLTLILLASILELLSTSLRASRVYEGKIEAQQTARHAVDNMVRDLLFAKKITINSPTNIVLETATDDIKKPQPTITYFLETKDHTLRREQNDGSGAQPITGASGIPVSITMLKFENFKKTESKDLPQVDTVRITLTATANVETDDKTSYNMETMVTRLK